MANVLSCKYCGQRLMKYEPQERQFGNPIRTCPNCGREYLDPRYREPAISGIPASEFSKGRCFILMIIGALLLLRGVYLFSVRQLGTSVHTQWVLPAVVTIFGAFLIILAIVDLIMILSGSKKKKYDKLYAESKKRIENESYVLKLRHLGYPFPDGWFE